MHGGFADREYICRLRYLSRNEVAIQQKLCRRAVDNSHLQVIAEKIRCCSSRAPLAPRNGRLSAMCVRKPNRLAAPLADHGRFQMI
jgi:hypothetical protein